MTPPPTPIPSATVVLLRGGARELEVLLMQRAPRGESAGAWVFPGGRVEPQDVAANDSESSLESARAAALRETQEEAALTLTPSALHPVSRWITPAIRPRRFDTWFFLAREESGQAVRPDGREMVAHRWLAPRAAMEANGARTLELAPPQFVTLAWLAEFATADAALRTLPARALFTFRPKVLRHGDGAVMLYAGDAGYESGDAQARGARHRAVASAGGALRYERS